MSKTSPKNCSRTRFLKAYWTFGIIFISYCLAGLKRRFFGRWVGDNELLEVHRRNAKRIESTILELKGIYIKVGQMLSIMSNFLPDELRRGLEGLQDAVPPHPYPAIEERFLQEFGKKPDDIFSRFEKVPIASASLGQVHVAFLPDGTKVAVKVQYPEIEEIVRIDLKTMKKIFSFLHLLFPHYGLKIVYREIAEVVCQELDYLYEGKNLESLRDNFKNEKDFLFPDVYWDFSSSRILTLRFMEGMKVSDLAGLRKAGLAPRTIATKIIHGYCKQIFLDGVYHADPHPGNLLIQQDGRIVLVDFGALARISEGMQKGITQFAEGLIKRDTRILAAAMRQMGFVAREEGMEPFEKLIDYLYGRLTQVKVENFKDLNLANLQNVEELLELKKLNISFKDLISSFHVPRDWLLLERTMLLVVGLTTHLDPTLNPVEIVLPYVERFVLKDRALSDALVTMVQEIGLSYLRLPHEIYRTLRLLNEGQLTIRNLDLRSHSDRLDRLGHRFLYAILMVGGFFLGLRLEEVGFTTESRYTHLAAAVMGLFLAVSLVRNKRS